MDFALSGFFSIFPNGFLLCLFKREPRILPSMALHFALSHRIFTMSLQEGTTDFAFNGFIFSLPRGFTPCLLRENYHGLLPSVVFYFSSSGYRVSSEKTIMDFCPQWSFIFHPVDTVSPHKELSRVFILSGFSFYFKSPIVLSSKRPFLLYYCDA